jgi:hypothetical protein
LGRFERVSCCQILGFQNQAKRHNIEREGKADSADSLRSAWGKWIWIHDAEEYAYNNYGAALRHLLTGSAFQNTNIPPGYTYKPWSVDEMLEMQESGKPIVLPGDWS